MALSNLLKCWLCDNVNLNLVWISRVLGARRQCMTVFSKKKLNKTSVKRLIFYKLDTSLKLKWEKLLVKDVQNGMYCTSKTLSCNRWTAIWLRQQQKWPVKQKKLISTPVLGTLQENLQAKLLGNILWARKQKFITQLRQTESLDLFLFCITWYMLLVLHDDFLWHF